MSILCTIQIYLTIYSDSDVDNIFMHEYNVGYYDAEMTLITIASFCASLIICGIISCGFGIVATHLIGQILRRYCQQKHHPSDCNHAITNEV